MLITINTTNTGGVGRDISRSPESALVGWGHARSSGTVECLAELIKVAEWHVDAVLERTVRVVVYHDANRLRPCRATPDLERTNGI